ncbi:MAG: hypothetical protein K8T10_07695 [Candidatus Eremiobacteraeota bacterium]|nr:hypothetical protein [Candidatus Eremiobacteraeota bacterium]
MAREDENQTNFWFKGDPLQPLAGMIFFALTIVAARLGGTFEDTLSRNELFHTIVTITVCVSIVFSFGLILLRFYWKIDGKGGRISKYIVGVIPIKTINSRDIQSISMDDVPAKKNQYQLKLHLVSGKSIIMRTSGDPIDLQKTARRISLAFELPLYENDEVVDVASEEPRKPFYMKDDIPDSIDIIRNKESIKSWEKTQSGYIFKVSTIPAGQRTTFAAIRAIVKKRRDHVIFEVAPTCLKLIGDDRSEAEFDIDEILGIESATGDIRGAAYLGIQTKTNLIRITGIVFEQQEIVADLIKAAIRELKTKDRS